MAKTKKTARELLEESFEMWQFESSGSFEGFTIEEYRGYVVGNVLLNNLNRGYSLKEYMEEARELYK